MTSEQWSGARKETLIETVCFNAEDASGQYAAPRERADGRRRRYSVAGRNDPSRLSSASLLARERGSSSRLRQKYQAAAV